jgi:hypothetical protein
MCRKRLRRGVEPQRGPDLRPVYSTSTSLEATWAARASVALSTASAIRSLDLRCQPTVGKCGLALVQATSPVQIFVFAGVLPGFTFSATAATPTLMPTAAGPTAGPTASTPLPIGAPSVAPYAGAEQGAEQRPEQDAERHAE